MPATRHCRHCMLGGCNGGCLLPGGSGLCIHRPVPRLPPRDRLRLIATRRFWRRLLWGPGPPSA
jgi:hypothetical protein